MDKSENELEFEIDEFEKLYVVTAAKMNSSAELDGIDISDEDFEKVSNLAKYKMENQRNFSEEERSVVSQDLNYYMIPYTVTQKVRNGNEEETIERQTNLMTDSSGNGLYLIMDDGMAIPTKELRDEVEFAISRYQKEIAKCRISREEIEEMFYLSNIEEISKMIKEKDLSLKNIQELVNEKAMEKGLRPNPIAPEKAPEKDEEEQDDEELEELENQEEELEEEDIEEKAIAAGVSMGFIEMIAERYKCRPDQINFRKIENLEKVQEDTGLNLRDHRGRVLALRINYGVEQRYYLIDSVTGERFETHKVIDNGSIDEVKDYFRYPQNRRTEDTKPLRRDEDRSYITYLDVNGDVKEMKYINNGKKVDMVKEERQRYIAEVAKVDNLLQDAIDVYQKDNTQENWLKVKDAMKSRVQIDKKYNVLENQRRITKETIDETLDETLRKSGTPEPVTKRVERQVEEDDDDWFPGPGRRRW